MIKALGTLFALKLSRLNRVGLGILISVIGAGAEPYLAVRTGFKCSQCHVNRIGGGERTEYGSAYTQYKLLMTQTEELMQIQGGQTSFNPKLNNSITVGANFRVEETGTQKYTYRDTGTHIAPANNALGIKEANVYLNFELVKNRLNLYVDQNMAGAGAREIWMMARNFPLNGYVKVGQALLPYGLRLMDDQAFIRSKTDYTYNNPAIGAEIGIEPGPLSLTANLTNTRFSSVGSVVYRNFRVGGSFGTSVKDAMSARTTFDQAYGPFVGFNFGRITFMSEVDFIRLPSDSIHDIHQVAQFYEVDALPIQGVNVKATYEYFDKNTDIANKYDGQERWTFGIEPFVSRFLQVGVYYRMNKWIPQNTAENQDQIIGRAHVFF